MAWWMVATALATTHPDPELCNELRRAKPQLEVVDARLTAGADPNATCRWEARVPLISTFPGVVFAVLAPPIGIPIGITERVTKTRKALPLRLAVRSGDAEVVGSLLDRGARPYPWAVEDAVEQDDGPVVERLLAAGASPALSRLPAPLAGDMDRLAVARMQGLQLQDVSTLGESWALRTDAEVATAFLDAGLPPEVLLVAAADVGGNDVVALCLARTDPVSDPAVQAMGRAVEDGRWGLVDQLLAAGVPLDPVERGRCLLCDATWDGSSRRTRELLARGADPNARGPAGWPLEHAARRGRRDLVALLVDAGAEPDRGLPDAVREGRWSVVDQLVDAGGQLDRRGVLLASVRSDRADAVQQLLRRGVPADARVEEGTWAVAAVDAHRPELLAELLSAGAAIDGTTTTSSPLQAAIGTGQADLVREVLALGADPAALPDLDAAWGWYRRPELEAVLLEAGVRPSPKAFVRAVQSGDVEVIRAHLASGADPNATEEYGDHPLEAAPSRDIQDLLLATGARPPGDLLEDLWRDGNRSRLLEMFALSGVGAEHLPGDVLEDAVDDGDEEAVAWLLDHGANPNGRTFFDDPVLWHALEKDHADIVVLLLDAGADASGVYRRDAALVVAIEGGHVELVGPLVAAGADLQPEADSTWTTPERAAIRSGNQAVRALLDAGHPATQELVEEQARVCDLEGLEAHRSRWPDTLAVGAVRRAARWGGCGREVRVLLR